MKYAITKFTVCFTILFMVILPVHRACDKQVLLLWTQILTFNAVNALSGRQ